MLKCYNGARDAETITKKIKSNKIGSESTKDNRKIGNNKDGGDLL